MCTGALLLAAAGLLDGYEATDALARTSDRLQSFGARYRKGRVVVDRNRFSGGGVTAGIDFGLHLAAELAGETVARAIQLGIEYNPAPPYDCGHPDNADPAMVAMIRQRLAAREAEFARR